MCVQRPVQLPVMEPATTRSLCRRRQAADRPHLRAVCVRQLCARGRGRGGRRRHLRAHRPGRGVHRRDHLRPAGRAAAAHHRGEGRSCFHAGCFCFHAILFLSMRRCPPSRWGHCCFHAILAVTEAIAILSLSVRCRPPSRWGCSCCRAIVASVDALLRVPLQHGVPVRTPSPAACQAQGMDEAAVCRFVPGAAR